MRQFVKEVSTQSVQTSNISTGLPVFNVEEETQSAVCGVVVEKKPVKPEDDVTGEYIWKLVNPHSPEFSQFQLDGYVFASNSYAQYIYLRKAREEVSHRFKTVDHVHIANSVVYLGDCRTTSCSITRDVISVVPKKLIQVTHPNLQNIVKWDRELYLWRLELPRVVWTNNLIRSL